MKNVNGGKDGWGRRRMREMPHLRKFMDLLNNGHYTPELDMGPFLLTHSKSIHELMDQIQSVNRLSGIKSH